MQCTIAVSFLSSESPLQVFPPLWGRVVSCLLCTLVWFGLVRFASVFLILLYPDGPGTGRFLLPLVSASGIQPTPSTHAHGSATGDGFVSLGLGYGDNRKRLYGFRISERQTRKPQYTPMYMRCTAYYRVCPVWRMELSCKAHGPRTESCTGVPCYSGVT